MLLARVGTDGKQSGEIIFRLVIKLIEPRPVFMLDRKSVKMVKSIRRSVISDRGQNLFIFLTELPEYFLAYLSRVGQVFWAKQVKQCC